VVVEITGDRSSLDAWMKGKSWNGDRVFFI
jgi:hypothetical protein